MQNVAFGVVLTIVCYELYRFLSNNSHSSASNSQSVDKPGRAPPTSDEPTEMDAHLHCQQKITAERKGRINAEKMLRAGVVDKISDPSIGYPLLVIGKIKSPFHARRGTPRQGLLVPDSRSIVELSHEIPMETLLGLEGYSHMFIQFLFHENTNLVKTLLNSDDVSSRSTASKSSTFSKRVNSFAAKVLPPLLNGGSIGVFASRSPHRPNALGLSLVKIIKVNLNDRTILVGGADLVNNTPVVDLKPWGPFDCPTCIHNTVDHTGIISCSGLADRCQTFHPRIPDWVKYGLDHPYILPIEWNGHDIEIELIVDSNKCTFYSKGESLGLLRAIEQMLGLDIRSVHRGRGRGDDMPAGVASELIGDRLRGSEEVGGQIYEVDYDALHIVFRVFNGGHPTYRSIPYISIQTIGLCAKSQ